MIDFWDTNTPQKLTTKRTRRKVLVPKSKQPLFDPLSKVRLQPGTPIPQYQIDDSWLLLKHRDNLQDFIDLNAAEKEYLQVWDAFILRQHISSPQYLPRNFLRFVRENAAWLSAKRSRTDEFSRHVATLLARCVLPDEAVFKATRLLEDARARRAAGEELGDEPASALQPVRNKASGGCCTACGGPVPPATMLVCANKVRCFFLIYTSLRVVCMTSDANGMGIKECENRLYHDTCVEDTEEAVAKGRHWRCKTCSS